MTDLQKERFTMAPVALIEMMGRGEIAPQAYALWHVLWSYSDSENRECWPSRATLAESLGLKKASSVDRYIDQLVDVGAVVKFGRSDGREQLSNGYRLIFDVSAGHSLSPTGDRGSPLQGTGVVPQRGHEQEPLNNNHLTITLSPNRPGSERVTTESKDEKMFSIAEDVGTASNEEAKTMPHLMPVGWQPNDIHRAMFERLHPGEDMGSFTDCFIALHDGVESGDWDKKFGAYINRVAESEAAQVTHLDMELNLKA